MKIGRRSFFLIVLIVLSITSTACSEKIDTNMSEQMLDFEFTSQDEETVSLEDLRGEWWITYMLYTHCRTVCPQTTANMVDIQKALEKEGLHPQIVSFSVDPENDTPDELRQYAADYGANLDTWDFLTGYDFDTIQEISEKTFRAVLNRGAVEQMSHSYMFYLVNPDGEVVKKYDGMATEGPNELINDIKTVLQ